VIEADRPPYPGLRPFERNETHLFFGRDDCVGQMTARLAERRFLAVLGSSGTGKSSLVKTGLLSGLEMGLLPGAGSRWLIAEFRPGGNPLRHLAGALLRAESTAKKKPEATGAEITGLETRFKQQGPRELIKWCQEGHLPEGANLLVLVDQFEELFNYQSNDQREEAQAMVSLLLESRWPRGVGSPRESDVPIYVAITMRSEYLGACTLLKGLAEAINEGTFLTPRMTRQQCEEAIVGPARVCRLEIEPRLVTKLLNDLEDFAPWDEGESKDQLSRLARRADQLPLMQHALNRIWQRARAQHNGGEEITLKLADYRGLEQELDDHAEEVFGRLNMSEQAAAKCVFQAVTLGTTVANAVRRPTKYGELVKICGAKNGGAVAKVLAEFGPRGCQFLTSDRPQTGDRLPDDAWIDIAHESLIRQWKRLSGWLEQEGRWSREWQQLKQDTDRSWYLQGRRLKDAVQLRKEARPTSEWAARYGGGFERIAGLVRLNQWLKRGFVVAAIAIAVAVSWVAYDNFDQRQAVVRGKIAAVTSAAGMLDRVMDSWKRGRTTLSGANDTIVTVLWFVNEQLKDVDLTSEYIRLLVNVACTASDIYGDLGNYTEAQRVANAARDLVQPLRTKNPDTLEVLTLLYMTTWRIGDAISYQGLDSIHQNEALDEFRVAETLAQRLATNSPKDRAWRRELMFIHQKIGDVHQALDKLEDSIREYQTALTLIEAVVAEEPRPKWRLDVAGTVIRIGQILEAKGDLDGALERFRTALDMRLELEKEIRSGEIVQSDLATTIQSNLASNHRYIAQVYVQRYDRDAAIEDLDTALDEYQTAVQIQERLLNNDLTNATWQVSLAASRIGYAALLRRKGELAAALKQARYAYALREALAEKDQLNSSRQKSLAMAAISVADLLTQQKENLDEAVKQKNLDEAMKLYRDAIEILDEAKPRDDSNVFESYIKIGNILDSRADWDGALKEYKLASGIALDAAGSKPDSVKWQRNLAKSYDKIGDVLAGLKNAREAITQYQKALEIVKALAAKYPQAAEWGTFAESLNAKIGKFASAQ
jgi:tetratricopeptide (TPR) repeat protein